MCVCVPFSRVCQCVESAGRVVDTDEFPSFLASAPSGDVDTIGVSCDSQRLLVGPVASFDSFSFGRHVIVWC